MSWARRFLLLGAAACTAATVADAAAGDGGAGSGGAADGAAGAAVGAAAADADADAGACELVRSRVDCGYSNITAADCRSRGCCFSATDDSSGLLFSHAFAAAPPRCFYAVEGAPVTKVVLIQSNHFDAGYTAAHEPARYARRFTGALLDVVNMYFGLYFPAAIATATELRQRGGKERLRYMTHSYLAQLYLRCPPGRSIDCPHPTAVAVFREAAQRGDIWWHAMPHNAELATMAPSTISAAIASTHALDDSLALPRKAVVSQRDVPGVPRGVLPVMAAAGVRAISVGANGDVLPPNVPPAFIWRDGTAASASAAAAASAAARSRANLTVNAPSQKEIMVCTFTSNLPRCL